MRTATDIHTAFALALHEALAPAGAVANHVCSPWSVSCALAVLAPGVDEAARAEIEAALGAGTGLGEPPVGGDRSVVERSVVDALAADASAVTRRGPVPDESVLAVVDTLWVEETYSPVPAFVDRLGDWPGAGVRSAPLIADPDGARGLINQDVAGTTRGLVPEILPPGSLSPDDRAVLVNALYLLAGWIQRFSEDRTVEEAFHAPSGTRPVPTMRAVREARYAALDGWAYLALPLWLELRAEVFLPPAAGSPDVVARPGPELVGRLRAAGREHRVDLHLPRFRVEAKADLVGPLRALGVRSIFEPVLSPLTGIVEQAELYVSGAFHGAVLRVDERGVEGAAATAIVARQVSYRILPAVEMRVDRPFWFLVTHRETGAVLFLARVVDPAGIIGA